MSGTDRESLFSRWFARHVGTPWWNFRFWLGYRIGGFTSAKRDY